MLIYGAGGHAKVVIEAIEANQIAIGAVFDDDSSRSKILDYPVVGRYSSTTSPGDLLIVAIGDNLERTGVSRRVRHGFATVSHPSAVISPRSVIGEGSVVLHNSTVQSLSMIGRHVIINTSASVGHDCQVEDFVHIGSNSTLCGGLRIGSGTQIGAGATVIPNISIGKWCVIGAGATVTKNVADFSVVAGVPARVIRRNSGALEALRHNGRSGIG